MKFGSKSLGAGFVILCPDGNVGNLKHTVKSLKFWYPGQDYICVVEQGIHSENLKDLKEVCPTYKAKKTMTSLINTGMRNAPKGWNLIIIAGSWLHGGELIKYSRFVRNEKEVIFPISSYERDGRKHWITEWEKGTLNGILMHTKTFKEVGPFADVKTPLDISKTMWGIEAYSKGVQIKPILGPKIT